MYKCSKCETETKNGFFLYTGRFVCKTCYQMEPWHTDRFTIEDNQVIRKTPYDGLSEEAQRSKFIEFAYNIFGNKLAPAAYRMMKQYRAKHSWIEMTRAMEYFYLVRRNSTDKAKNNIGIIPYVIEEAKAFYEKENVKVENQTRALIQGVKKYNETTREEVKVKNTTRKDKQINLEDL